MDYSEDKTSEIEEQLKEYYELNKKRIENVGDQLKLILQYCGLELSLETFIDVYSSQALDPHVNRDRFRSEWWD